MVVGGSGGGARYAFLVLAGPTSRERFLAKQSELLDRIAGDGTHNVFPKVSVREPSPSLAAGRGAPPCPRTWASLSRIPVIGSIARGDQRLNCSMRGSRDVKD